MKARPKATTAMRNIQSASVVLPDEMSANRVIGVSLLVAALGLQRLSGVVAAHVALVLAGAVVGLPLRTAFGDLVHPGGLLGHGDGPGRVEQPSHALAGRFQQIAHLDALSRLRVGVHPLAALAELVQRDALERLALADGAETATADRYSRPVNPSPWHH